MNRTEKLAHSVTDGARMFGVSDATMWRRVKDGSIRTIKVGSRRLIPTDEIARLMREGTEAKQSAA